MKEASLVLGWLLSTLPIVETEGAEPSTLASIRFRCSTTGVAIYAGDFSVLCQWMRELMLQCRHKGVVELIGSAFEPVCMRSVLCLACRFTLLISHLALGYGLRRSIALGLCLLLGYQA